MKRIVTVEIPEGERCFGCPFYPPANASSIRDVRFDYRGMASVYIATTVCACYGVDVRGRKCQACLDADKEKASD